MNFKYYDLLSSIVVGYLMIILLIWVCGFTYDESYSIAYLVMSYVVGYIINAISSLMEPLWFLTIGGKPSDKFLTKHNNKSYTGINKVRFYQTQKAIELLKRDIGNENPNNVEMFELAMRYTNDNSNSRVQDFNAHYAFSRMLLTTMFIVIPVIIITFYNCWASYFLLLPLLIAWNRYRERAYYYAREVLNEYIKTREKIN